MTSIRVSVALCTYNGAKYLAAQLDSILCQTRPADEIVIIDDCSSDETVAVIKAYAQKTDVIKFFVNERNLGYIRNFSNAISATTGDFVALADQDDVWTKDHIEKLLNNIGNKAVCVGDAQMMSADGQAIGKTFREIKQNFYIPDNDVAKTYRIIYNLNPYQGASMLINRRWAEKFLPIPDGADYHDTFFACCACLTQGLNVIPDIINNYRMHEGQVSKKWETTVFDEIKHRRHHICYPSKEVLINTVSKYNTMLSPEAVAFIDEFKHILALDKQKKRFQVLKIKNRHYKEIYSCFTYKYITIRSLHFLLSL